MHAVKWVGTYSLGHTNTGITDGDGLGLLVRNDVDAEVLARIELGRVRQGLIANLVESIRGVGDQLPQENLFVGVDSVDNERQELRNLSLKLEGFSSRTHFESCLDRNEDLRLVDDWSVMNKLRQQLDRAVPGTTSSGKGNRPG
jgi:hypothetical protein